MMRRFRGTFILVIAAVLLTAYTYFMEREPGPDPVGRGLVFPFLRERDVDRLVIERSGGRVAIERARDGEWWIREPMDYPADPNQVEFIVRQVRLLAARKILDDPPADAFAGSMVAAIAFTDRGRERRVEAGGVHPVEQTFHYYRYRGKVFLGEGRLKEKLRIPLDDVRSRLVSGVHEDRATKLVVVGRDGPRLEVRRDEPGLGWRITSPFEGRGDEQAVSSLIGFLNGLDVREFVRDEPGDLAVYGLDPRGVRWTVTVGERGQEVKLLVGGDAPEEEGKPRLFMKRADRPHVWIVYDRITKDLSRPPEAYRDRRIFDVGADPLEAIDVRVAGRDFRVALEKGLWEVKDRARDRSFPGDQEQVDLFRDECSRLRVFRFLEKAPPAMSGDAFARIVLEFEGGRKSGVRLWETGDSQSFHGRRDDDPAPFEDTSGIAFRLKNRGPSYFRDRSVAARFKIAAHNLVEFEVSDGRHEPVRVGAVGGGRKLPAPLDLDVPDEISSSLAEFIRAPIARNYVDEQEDLKALEVSDDTWWIRIRITDSGDDTPRYRTLLVGRLVRGGEEHQYRYVRIPEIEELFIADTRPVRAFIDWLRKEKVWVDQE